MEDYAEISSSAKGVDLAVTVDEGNGTYNVNSTSGQGLHGNTKAVSCCCSLTKVMGEFVACVRFGRGGDIGDELFPLPLFLTTLF